MIRTDGPQPLDRVMALALTAQSGGYYTSNSPIGAQGDFVTAPEISQTFGEMVGAWLLQSWIEIGEPSEWSLVELGPGRGTLMADILRVLRLRPEALGGARIHLVEVSPVLRSQQSKTLKAQTDRPLAWHDSLQSVPEGPTLIIANEFFDALPVRQLVSQGQNLFERCINLSDQHTDNDPVFEFSLKPLPREALRAVAGDGVYEICPQGIAIAGEIGLRFIREPGRCLVFDYGYWGPAAGDTLQAMRGHKFHDPLSDLGAADLTAHVDFAALARAAERSGAATFGIVDQGEFLKRLGIRERAEALSNNNADVEKDVARLIDSDQMGTLFKCLCLSSTNVPPPPGFDLDRNSSTSP